MNRVLLCLKLGLFFWIAPSAFAGDLIMPELAHGGFGFGMLFDFGVRAEVAQVGSATLSYVPTRTMSGYGAETLLGATIYGSDWAFHLGTNTEVTWLGQVAAPSASGGTNVSGTHWVSGLGAGLTLGQFFLFGSYDFAGSYSMVARTNWDEKVSYHLPRGFRAMVRWKFDWGMPFFDPEYWYLGLHLASRDFRSQHINETRNALGGSNAFQVESLGLSFGRSF
jgi:hypothetical protein